MEVRSGSLDGQEFSIGEVFLESLETSVRVGTGAGVDFAAGVVVQKDQLRVVGISQSTRSLARGVEGRFESG